MSNYTSDVTISLSKKILISLLFAWFSFFAIIAAPNTSYAANEETALGATICRIIVVIQGPFGVGLSSFGIIFLGIGLFFGKVSWGLALAVILAIGCIFGASKIVNVFTKENTKDSCETVINADT